MASLTKYPPDGEYEVVMSADSLTEVDQQQFMGMTNTMRIYFPRPIPYAIKQNANIVSAKGDYIVICDDDIEFLHDGWAKALREALTGNRVAAACVTPGRVGRRGHQAVKPGCSPGDKVRGVAYFTGFCWMAPRRVFDWASPDYVGFYDCFGRSQCDDADWCLRARMLGHALVTCYGAQVLHKAGTNTRITFKESLRNYKRKWRAIEGRKLKKEVK